MTPPADWRPAAHLEMLWLRSALLAWTRQFFRDHGYWEVETPLLSHDVCVDTWLEPFAVQVPDSSHPAGGRTMYLQTSPEFGMKRLLAAGAEAIFQITRSFRHGDRGALHNPEFTIVEWYRRGDSYQTQMAFVEELVRGFHAAVNDLLAQLEDQFFPSPPGVVTKAERHDAGGEGGRRPEEGVSVAPFLRLTYEQAFVDALGTGVLALRGDELRQLARTHGVSAPASLGDDDRDEWLNLLLQSCVEPLLAPRGAVFVCDYPASQAALAQIRHDQPPVAERFELYLDGIEICNGYQELTDPEELRQRIAQQSRLRADAGLPPLPVDSRLLAAMDSGLPDCAGVALGFDRLLMSACGSTHIDDVLTFPLDRA